MTTRYVLEIAAEGMPRLVGPFETLDVAVQWGQLLVHDGEWNVTLLTAPRDADAMAVSKR